jgi:hypothetical protein
MRCITLITAAISVLAFVSQSASALPVQDSHREPSQLSKRQPGPGALDSLGGGGGGRLGVPFFGDGAGGLRGGPRGAGGLLGIGAGPGPGGAK